MQPSFAELSEQPAAKSLPPLDQPVVDESALTPTQLAWRRDGVAILPRFLPESLMDAYSKRRAALDLPGGWPYPNPDLEIPEMRELALYLPLMEQLHDLISEPMLRLRSPTAPHFLMPMWICAARVMR
jgi:hypothetical protein